MLMSNFWINEAIKALILYLSAFLLGLWVLMRGVKVNYTRKIFHFILFFFPIYLASLFPFSASISTTLISGGIFLGCILILCEPVRQKSRFLSVVFASIDRPEDRPFTLIWVSTQVLATYAVLVLMLWWLSSYEKEVLIYITVLVAGIGDGLAEPVGVRFGKRKYQTYALFTNKKYTRSIEGSLCVFGSGILAILLLQEHLTLMQILLALVVIPITMTIAEALSPHTWDGPFLYLTGGASTVFVLELSAMIV